jgi:hypothetical protein
MVGRHVLNLRQSPEPGLRWTMSCKSHRRVFCIDPAKQRAAFFRCRRDQSDTGWRWQKRDCGWINNLKNVKAEGVCDQGKRQKGYNA